MRHLVFASTALMIAVAACGDSGTEPGDDGPWLYMIRQTDDVLRRMDPETLEIVDIGPLGVEFAFGGCTWNPSNRRLYATDGRPNDVLYTIDLETGTATTVGTHGVAEMFGLEYHPPTNSLLAASILPRALHRLDAATGQATQLGETSGFEMDAIVWDATRNTLIGQEASIFGSAFYSLDPATGAATLLTQTPAINNHGMTYDPDRDLIWAADVDGEIFRYDPAAGYARETVAMNQGENACIAWVD